MFKTNDARQFLCSSEIIEWDIKSGNTSIMEKYQLVSQKTINRLNEKSKDVRTRSVGLMMRKDKEFSKALEKGFNDTVNEFITENGLDPGYDILSIKRDAVYVANRDIRMATFGPAVFIPKNIYHAFLYMKPFEFYFTENGIDVKGMSDEGVALHKDGILSIFQDIVELSEYGSPKDLTEYLVDLMNSYKKKELSLDVYRVFSNSDKLNGRFPLMMRGDMIWMDQIDESDLDRLYIDDNYKNILLSLINILAPY